MSEAIPLPSRPNIEHYKKVAKALRRGAPVDEPLNALWQRFKETKREPVLADAQFFIARAHGFASWPKFARHIEDVQRGDSPVSIFENAVDAIVDGDINTLRRLLLDRPDLVHERSTREHRSTLLHYVSANGVEDFRQKTPPNIVDIARLLLDSGADVNAESDAYRGHSTTLGLTATSYHPQKAGVQIALMMLLLERGARMQDTDVRDSLANGRGEAAEFLASRGAHLGFEGACGVSRLDAVKQLFHAAGEREIKDGFTWASEFGRTEVVRFLLEQGFDIRTQLPGPTGIHWAALGGHADLVKLLVERGAPVDAVESTFGGTPLTWALYGWGADDAKGKHYEVVARLVQAGARLPAEWFGDDEDRRRALNRIHSDPRMVAALGNALDPPRTPSES